MEDELKAKWNESDMIMRWSPEFLKIVGKHSTHWNYNKGETLLLLDEWLQDNYILKADVVEAMPEKITYKGIQLIPPADNKSYKLYTDGFNKAIDEIRESLNLEGVE